MMSNKFDIRILHNNFDILRKYKNLRKSEFCKLIGIGNAYRTDYSSLGAKLLKGIADHFSGIDEKWLLTPHNMVEELSKSYPHIYSKVAEPHEPYPQIVKISDPLIQKTAAILESSTVYATALKSNIEAFHHAMTCEEQLAGSNKRIDVLEENIKSIEKRLPVVNES